MLKIELLQADTIWKPDVILYNNADRFPSIFGKNISVRVEEALFGCQCSPFMKYVSFCDVEYICGMLNMFLHLLR